MVAVLPPAAAADLPKPPRFERDVWPVVSARCIACHGENEPKGGLDLRSVAAIERGGESGPALARSDPKTSLLLEKIVQGEMPPEGERRLTADEIALLTAWVLAGAPADDPTAIPGPVALVRDRDREFWSFRPLARSPVPVARDTARVRTAIDAFLLERLAAKRLGFSADADPTTLVRRVYLDLIGLPPSPEEVDAFLRDGDPRAYERLVDRLLASPHFGERWGRHWLDVAGYVDTIGFDTDATNVMLSEGKWRYRDYVIQSFNDDKPYDRFLVEQIAGDELYDWRRAKHFTPQMREALVATGYLRTARDLTHEDVGVIPQNFFGIMHDTLDTMGTGLLGLTLNCARCHTHKFDPIPQEDYYRLMAALTPAYNPRAWRPVIPFEPKIKDRALADIAPAEQATLERNNAAIDQQVEELRKSLAELRRPHYARLLAASLEKVPEPIRTDTKAALDTPAEKRTEVQKYLCDKFGGALNIKPEQVAAALSEDEKEKVADLETQVATAEQGRRKWGKIQALYDVAPPPATHLLVRGSEQTPGAEVQPGYLRVLCRSEADALATVAPPYDGTSGRRLALARWLTERESPAAALVARVMVNRVWQHLFGRGIVPTPDNFGAQGQPPTHPELLEWLSDEFVSSGWRVKPLVRSIALSTAYRQASRRDPTLVSGDAADPEVVDPANDLLWRMRLRRLDSEVVRDSILAVCGTLNDTMGGPPVPIDARPDGMVVVAKDKLAHPSDESRRSIYLVSRRAYNLSLLTVFDQPLVATNCVRRDASAVPLQSLVMMNDAFIVEQAEQLATRIEGCRLDSDEPRIAMLFRMTLGRRPNNAEITTCRDLVQQQLDACRTAGIADETASHQALVQLCHTVLNTSEFLYVE